MSDEEMKSVAASCRHFYWKLFQSTCLISAFTVGGGFVIIPLLKAKYVDEYGWLEDKETLDLAALAQSLPGVMAVNASILLGYRMAGIPGALTALSATILPPLITLSIIAQAYEAYAASPVVRLVLKQCRQGLSLSLLILVGTFIANFCFGVNLMLLIVIDAIVGFLFLRWKEPR